MEIGLENLYVDILRLKGFNSRTNGLMTQREKVVRDFFKLSGLKFKKK